MSFIVLYSSNSHGVSVSAFLLYRVSHKSQDTVFAAYTRFVHTMYLYCFLFCFVYSDNTNNTLNQDGRHQSIYCGREAGTTRGETQTRRCNRCKKTLRSILENQHHQNQIFMFGGKMYFTLDVYSTASAAGNQKFVSWKFKTFKHPFSDL